MSPTRTAQLELPADLLELRRLRPWLDRWLSDVAADTADGHAVEGLADGLELALHEVCVNAVQHAYEGAGGTLRIAASCADGWLHFSVSDSGRRFVSDDAPAPVPGIPQIHGYGLAIVRQLVDELRYEREEGVNQWHLSKQC